MKIISTLLFAFASIPIGVKLVTSYIADFSEQLSIGEHASFYSFPYDINSEPILMILLGTGLIGLAGFGRKKLSNRANDSKIKRDIHSVPPPYPNPVPWKKDSET